MAQNHSLRTSTSIYLVGHEYSQILGSKLPSNKQVLCAFFHNHRNIKLSVKDSAKIAVQEASVFWAKAQIPIRQEYHCVQKLVNLHTEWKILLKGRNKDTETQRRKEEEFVDKLDDVFDIAHKNALQLMKNVVDKEFLLSQRKKGRPGSLIGVDFKAIQKEKRKLQLAEQESARKQMHAAGANQRQSQQGVFIRFHNKLDS